MAIAFSGAFELLVWCYGLEDSIHENEPTIMTRGREDERTSSDEGEYWKPAKECKIRILPGLFNSSSSEATSVLPLYGKALLLYEPGARLVLWKRKLALSWTVTFLPLLLVVFSTRILFFPADSRTLTEPPAIATVAIQWINRFYQNPLKNLMSKQLKQQKRLEQELLRRQGQVRLQLQQQEQKVLLERKKKLERTDSWQQWERERPLQGGRQGELQRELQWELREQQCEKWEEQWGLWPSWWSWSWGPGRWDKPQERRPLPRQRQLQRELEQLEQQLQRQQRPHQLEQLNDFPNQAADEAQETALPIIQNRSAITNIDIVYGFQNQASNSDNPADSDEETAPPMNPNRNAMTVIIRDTEFSSIGGNVLSHNTFNYIQIDGKGFFAASLVVSIAPPSLRYIGGSASISVIEPHIIYGHMTAQTSILALILLTFLSLMPKGRPPSELEAVLPRHSRSSVSVT
ncbi:hypothetical protein C8J56DRAFT_900498 [Mycena floridula]|nr:hypothetical protein C8J56DRAFT_900498 [Mycena floridula]